MATDVSIDDRRKRASDLLAVHGFLPLVELARTLEVSDSTVRRDLEILEEQGVVRRTHGGAVYLKDAPAHQLAFADRVTTAVEQKAAVARAVAELIAPGQSLLLDGGTTCHQVARALQGRPLSVITNSVPIASLLAGDVATEVTLIGGYLYPRTGVALGAMAEQQLMSLHASQLVLSCAGVTEQGAFNANQMMVEVELRMVQAADQVILAIDSTKLGRRGVVQLFDLDCVDVMVTDAGADDSARDWLDLLDARVIYAPLNDGAGTE